MKAHQHCVNKVVFSSDGSMVCSASADSTIRIWDLTSDTTDNVAATLHGHCRDVRSVVITSSGRHVISASSDATVRAWDWQNGSVVYRLEGHTSAPCVRLVVGWEDHCVSLRG